VGCGIGNFALLLAEQVGNNGRVSGLDVSREFLDHATCLAAEAGLSNRVVFRQGNAANLPFEDSSFDWVWSVDCVGYGTTNSVALIKEMARVVSPGGTVAILAWSSERLLPGHPRLEAKLGATSAGIAPFKESLGEDQHLSRGLGWLRKVGLVRPTARALAGSACAPLTEPVRVALASLIDMRWPGVERELEPEDQREFQRLCDPNSAEYILDHPDYYAFFTYSLFWGIVGE
jgi:demethylmenaquinone methyltransferase/2-methoxy-6-polyprenyl-1,4-benzoquinol methylase